MSQINYFIVLVMLMSACATGAVSASPSIDQGSRIFEACTKREKKNLASCTSGCGLILKRCYDEAVEGYEEKILEIGGRQLNSECKRRMDEVSKKIDAFRGEIENFEESGSWQQMDIKLLLFRHKLQLIEIIERGCRMQ